MKRHGNLWGRIISEDNIRQGILHACLSKGRKSEAKKRHVAYTMEHMDETVGYIKGLLESGFRTSPYFIYPLLEPKLRFIYCLPFTPDRIVHHCLLNILIPIWDGIMYSGSYACRVGYGTHKAGTACGIYAQQYKYCAQFDISQFYVNINHDILKEIIRKKIKDTRVLETLDEIIDSINTRDRNLEILYQLKSKGVQNPDIDREIAKLEFARNMDTTGAGVGLPIGSYTSQWMGNLYLNELDTFIKQELHVKPYPRYCDDFSLFGNSKEELKEQSDRIEQFLWERLRMTLSRKRLFPTAQGVDFVGYRYFHSGMVLLRKRTAKKQKRTIACIRKGMGQVSFNAEKARSQLGSMNGTLKWAKTYNFRKSQGLDSLTAQVAAMVKEKEGGGIE